MKNISATTKELRKFGLMFTVIFLLLAAFSLYKGTASWRWFLCGSAFFLLTGLFVHQILRPIYIGWMKFAAALGWFNTRLILGIVFYIIFTPVSLVLKLFGRDVLGMRLDRASSSYWIKRERTAFDKKRYEQLF